MSRIAFLGILFVTSIFAIIECKNDTGPIGNERVHITLRKVKPENDANSNISEDVLAISSMKGMYGNMRIICYVSILFSDTTVMIEMN